MIDAVELDLSDVSFRFGGNLGSHAPIFDRFNLCIQPGEFVAVLGPSGSGKSTLLRILAGLLPVSDGQLRRTPEHASSSFVFQDPTLLPWRTVAENVFLPFELDPHRVGDFNKPETSEQLRARVSEILERLDMTFAHDYYPRELSGGMKMRASIARALVTVPRVLFFDEPFAALDEPHRHALQVQLRKLWDEFQMTVIFVTHTVAEAVFLADRAIVLSNGRPTTSALDLNLKSGHRRDSTYRTSPSFNELVRKIYEVQSRDLDLGIER
jgi:NitT/TauT family transport system ATP-binding protein